MRAIDSTSQVMQLRGNDNSAIGRANIDGTSSNQSFISTPSRVLGVAVDSLAATTATVAITPSSDPIVYGQSSSPRNTTAMPPTVRTAPISSPTSSRPPLRHR
jgi:hypothetical protein